MYTLKKCWKTFILPFHCQQLCWNLLLLLWRETTFCWNSPLLRVDLFPPKLSFPKAADMFIPGRNWEYPQLLSALFDYGSSEFKSRHILSLRNSTQKWRISFCCKRKGWRIHWRRMVTSPSGSPEYCNIISKVCLHQFMALQWKILPLFQLFLHGCCHSKESSLGICRCCYNFFFPSSERTTSGLEKSSKAFGSVTCLQWTVSILWVQKIGSVHAGVGGTQEQEGNGVEEKHVNEFVPTEDFWASPLITWIMKT